MRLYELMHRLDWQAIQEALLRLYPKEKKHLHKHAGAHARLMALQPSESGTDRTRLCIEMRRDQFDGKVRADVCGKDGTLWRESDPDRSPAPGESSDEERHWALDFLAWETVLAMELDRDTLARLSEADIVARILYEITFWGYDPEVIEAKAAFMKGTPDPRALPKKRGGRKK